MVVDLRQNLLLLDVGGVSLDVLLWFMVKSGWIVPVFARN